MEQFLMSKKAFTTRSNPRIRSSKTKNPQKGGFLY